MTITVNILIITYRNKSTLSNNYNSDIIMKEGTQFVDSNAVTVDINAVTVDSNAVTVDINAVILNGFSYCQMF